VVDDGTHAGGGAAALPRNGLQPLLVVVMSPQVVQVPVIARTMTHRVTTMTTNQRQSSKYPWLPGGST